MNRIFLTLVFFLLLLSPLRAELYVDNSDWKVEEAENGRNEDYHSVLWSFLPDGKVYAGDLWRGVWFKKSGNTIKLVIVHKNSRIDIFEVKFENPSEFIAYKEGQVYRYGVRARISCKRKIS